MFTNMDLQQILMLTNSMIKYLLNFSIFLHDDFVECHLMPKIVLCIYMKEIVWLMLVILLDVDIRRILM